MTGEFTARGAKRSLSAGAHKPPSGGEGGVCARAEHSRSRLARYLDCFTIDSVSASSRLGALSAGIRKVVRLTFIARGLRKQTISVYKSLVAGTRELCGTSPEEDSVLVSCDVIIFFYVSA